MRSQEETDVLFGGKIPVQFSLDDSEVTSVKIPLPYYALLSRMSYLRIQTEEVVNHFKGSVIDLEQSIWFEYKGKPLKSNLPIGVLFDLHAHDVQLPWKVTIHFRQFPGNMLVRSSTTAEAESLYSHSLKQAVFLLSGNTRLFTSLSIQKQLDLHQSIAAGDGVSYHEVMREIASAVTKSSSRSLPVVLVVDDGRPTMQRPVNVYKKTSESAEITTLKHNMKESNNSEMNDELEEKIDESIPETRNNSVIESTSPASEENVPHLTTLQDVINDSFQCSDIGSDNIREIVVQGICLPPEVPIYDIWEAFCHLDLFLYIIVRISN